MRLRFVDGTLRVVTALLDTARWVPEPSPDWRDAVERLVDGVRDLRLCVLTGAGCSTESGIPDYRGEGTARRARNPIQFRQFISDSAGRRRYWARSMHGWPSFVSAQPSPAHRAIADLERNGRAVGVITQNVDRLHQMADTQRVVELHGALAEVLCLSCGVAEKRSKIQERLLADNPGWLAKRVDLAPDGDADWEADLSDFVVPSCQECMGILKPNVVFFGEGVNKAIVENAYALLEEADGLLVAGTSLTVFSGFRFVRRAQERKMPIFVVNIGTTRADPLAKEVVRGRVGDVLSMLR